MVDVGNSSVSGMAGRENDSLALAGALVRMLVWIAEGSEGAGISVASSAQTSINRFWQTSIPLSPARRPRLTGPSKRSRSKAQSRKSSKIPKLGVEKCQGA